MTPRAHLTLPLALLTVVALSACGGPNRTGRTTDAAGTAPAAATPAAPSSAESARSGSSARPAAADGAATSLTPSASAARSATPSAEPSFRKAPLTVALGRLCVTPGGTQTLTLDTAAAPKGKEPMIVVFDNAYDDGKDGQVHGGIEKNGRAGADGHYTNTWLVSPTAPVGRTRIDIAVAGHAGTATAQHYYEVARTC